MFPSYQVTPTLAAERIRPDRRHMPTDSEIRLRIKRATQAV